jgi:hypothetical protein
MDLLPSHADIAAPVGCSGWFGQDLNPAQLPRDVPPLERHHTLEARREHLLGPLAQQPAGTRWLRLGWRLILPLLGFFL